MPSVTPLSRTAAATSSVMSRTDRPPEVRKLCSCWNTFTPPLCRGRPAGEAGTRSGRRLPPGPVAPPGDFASCLCERRAEGGVAEEPRECICHSRAVVGDDECTVGEDLRDAAAIGYYYGQPGAGCLGCSHAEGVGARDEGKRERFLV